MKAKQLRKLLCLALAGVMLLTGCGQDGAPSDAGSAEESSAAEETKDTAAEEETEDTASEDVADSEGENAPAEDGEIGRASCRERVS